MRRALLLIFLPCLAACPPDPSDPERPAGAACSSDVDCNPDGSTCGEIYVCVDARCERMPSRFVPCTGSP